MIAHLAILLAAVATAPLSVEVPLAEFNAHDVGFSCPQDGIPRLRLEHSGSDGVIRYVQSGSVGDRSFDLYDSVKSVTHERDNGQRRWVIRAEGTTKNANGIAADIPAVVDVTMTLPDGGSMIADFSVKAGSFSFTGKGCGRMPSGAGLLRKVA